MNDLVSPFTKEQQQAAQKRVDEASEEAFQLALDTMFDSAIQHALILRSRRNQKD